MFLFLAELQEEVRNGKRTPGYYALVKSTLSHFVCRVGAITPMCELSGRSGALILKGYRSSLNDEIREGQISEVTANHRIKQVKRLLRWAAELEVIESLPVIVSTPGALAVEVTDSAGPRVYEPSELRVYFQHASERTRLYLAMSMNFGFTQVDIARLENDGHDNSVDWDKRTITYKRQKTRRFKNVPVVTYPIWPVTYDLMLKFAANRSTGLVFQNANGAPLLRSILSDDGKLTKNDNVRNAWSRMVKKLENHDLRQKDDGRSLKHVRKTSATLLRSNPRFADLRHHFLGHAPKSIADVHYSAPSQQLFSDAVKWLEKQYAIKPHPDAPQHIRRKTSQ